MPFGISCSIFYLLCLDFFIDNCETFLDLITEKDATTYSTILSKGEPALGASIENLTAYLNYQLSGLIIHEGKMRALVTICFAGVFIFFSKHYSGI